MKSFQLLALSALSLAALGVAKERSLSLCYGPKEQVQFTLNRGVWGLYAQPIFSYEKSESYEQTETGFRGGLLFSYTAFTYRRLECRGQAGAGPHYAEKSESFPQRWGGPPIPDRKYTQAGVDFWVQPEFRFYERFAILLEAHALRYMLQKDPVGDETSTATFITPDYTLSRIGIGLRYYLPVGKQDPAGGG